MRDIEFHPFANVFPLMEGIAFRDLVEDVRVHGLREPILLFDGLILDGRNRYRACHAAQVSARFKTYDGKDPIAFVVSSNLHRRHLDASQRALVAASIAELKQGRGAPRKAGVRGSGDRLLAPLRDGGTGRRKEYPETVAPEIGAEKAGRLLNVSAPLVIAGKKVLRSGVPELVDAVRDGKAAVTAAAAFAELPADQQRQVLNAGGVDAVTVIGRQTREARLDQRRVERASAVATDKAVLDHFKIGDGRSIGNVRLGELQRLADRAALEAAVLSGILARFASFNHGDAVRDVLSAAALAEIIAAARPTDQAERA